MLFCSSGTPIGQLEGREQTPLSASFGARSSLRASLKTPETGWQRLRRISSLCSVGEHIRVHRHCRPTRSSVVAVTLSRESSGWLEGKVKPGQHGSLTLYNSTEVRFAPDLFYEHSFFGDAFPVEPFVRSRLTDG